MNESEMTALDEWLARNNDLDQAAGYDDLTEEDEVVGYDCDLDLDDTIITIGNNEALASLDEALQSLNNILENADTQAMPAELGDTMDELRAVLDGLSPDSELYQTLNSSMLRLNRALGNLENLTSTLAAQPNAAIMPSTPKPDPVPEVR